MSLLQLIFVVVDFNACVVFLVICGISLMYALMCSNIVVIMMVIAIIAWRGSAVCGMLISGLSWSSTCSLSLCNYFLSMSHPKSGILLVGTNFLPSLTFPICSSSYNWQTFSVMGIFLTSLWCTLVICPWLSLISI